MAIEVYILVIDPRLNRVSGPLAMPRSRFAMPYERDRTGRPRWTNRTVPENLSSAAS
jgi:hypothetical protein